MLCCRFEKAEARSELHLSRKNVLRQSGCSSPEGQNRNWTKVAEIVPVAWLRLRRPATDRQRCSVRWDFDLAMARRRYSERCRSDLAPLNLPFPAIKHLKLPISGVKCC